MRTGAGFCRPMVMVLGLFASALLLLGGTVVAMPKAAAQATRGSVGVTPFVPDPDINGGPFLPGVCFQLTGENYSATDCSKEELSTSALFASLDFGTYELALISAPAGCSAPELPTTVEVATTERVYVNVAMACEMTTLTVHVAECAADVSANIFEACHENRLAGVNLLIETDTYITDANGVATAFVTSGPTNVREFPIPEGYVGVHVYCSDQANGSVLFDSSMTNQFTFHAPAAGEVVCDIYNLMATSGEEPSGEEPEVETPVIELPNTGAGSPANGTNLTLSLGLLALILGVLAVMMRRQADRI